MEDSLKRSVMVCETQPITAEGLKNLIEGSPDLDYLGTEYSLEQSRALALRERPGIAIVDKGFGMRAVLDWIHEVKLAGADMDIVVWGVSMTEAEALRLLQAGARGIVRKTAALTTVLTCLQTVAAGRSWMEDAVFRDSITPMNQVGHSDLTAREQQVLQLVEQGFKNKEIAMELGIRPGTVKIHLKHIFEKTGVRGRYGLAINGLKDKGLVSLAS